MDVQRFRADLLSLATRACAEDEPRARTKVFELAEILVSLHRSNLVKVNHSALELVCARSLVKDGYDVKVEHKLDKTLVCDVLGTGNDEKLIVEIETGFVPPEHALEPSAYVQARVSSKIARYSRFAGRFALGTTPSYVLDLPEFFVIPPGSRKVEEGMKVKALTDRFYSKPPIALEDFMVGRLDSIFIVDVDSASCERMTPRSYFEAASAFGGRRLAVQALNQNGEAAERGFTLERSAGTKSKGGGWSPDA